MFKPISASVAILSLVGAGCSSVDNMRVDSDAMFGYVNKVPPKTVFGGTELDINQIHEGWVALLAGTVTTGKPEHNVKLTTEEWLEAPLITLPFVVDLPLSIVGDTVTLPITLYHAYHSPSRPANEKPGEKPVSSGSN